MTGTPAHRTRAQQRRIERLREVVAQLDAGLIVVRGHDGRGAEWNRERLRKHLERRIADLEGRR
jgi:hypothetical protein